MKSFIFVPVVNHFELLERAIRSVPAGVFDDYLIINNSGSSLDRSIYDQTAFRVIDPPRRMSFRETQNAMREFAVGYGYDSYSFMHNDGFVEDDTVQRMLDMANNLGSDWGVIFTHYDVLCLFSTRASNVTGEWGDALWPVQQSGYYLDNDYYRRMQLNGFSVHHLTPHGVQHAQSNTIRDSHEMAVWESQREAVRRHYLAKWGGPPNEESADRLVDLFKF